MRFFFICAHAVGQVFLICGRPKLFKHAVAIENGHRGIKTETITKVVPVRAVNLSIGPFCTEFRCEQLCDDGIFRDRGQLLAIGVGNRCFFLHAVAIVFFTCGRPKLFSHAVGLFFVNMRRPKFCSHAAGQSFFTCGWPPHHIKKKSGMHEDTELRIFLC